MVAVPVDVCPVLLTRVATGRHQVLMRDDAPGPLFYRRLAALGILCDLGRVFKQVPISQGLSAAFSRPGGLVLGRENAGKSGWVAPRPPQGL